jgi:hypothetical protein
MPKYVPRLEGIMHSPFPEIRKKYNSVRNQVKRHVKKLEKNMKKIWYKELKKTPK